MSANNIIERLRHSRRQSIVRYLKKFYSPFQRLIYPLAVRILWMASIITSAILIYIGFEEYGETGFEGMSLIDWLELLGIPLVLASAAYFFTQRENDIEREIAREKRHEDIFQNYLDKMTELMVRRDWLARIPVDDKTERLFDIARMRTITTLRALQDDKVRQSSVIQFLREAELFDGEKHPALLACATVKYLSLSNLNLKGADLRRAVLSNVNLRNADLSAANLEEADLSSAKLFLANLEESNLKTATMSHADLLLASLTGADLRNANIEGANLRFAILRRVNLEGARLRGARLGGENFKEALRTLPWLLPFGLWALFPGPVMDKNTTLPDGTPWSPEVDMKRFTDPEHSEFWEPDGTHEARQGEAK